MGQTPISELWIYPIGMVALAALLVFLATRGTRRKVRPVVANSTSSSEDGLPKPDPEHVEQALEANPGPMGRCTIGLSGEPSARR